MPDTEALAILKQAMSTGLPLHWSAYALIVFTSLLAAAAGAWFGAYFTEKGKNYATTEDLDKILDQVRKTTEATEVIRAEVSGDLWERQNRWAFKKDVYLRLLAGLSDAASAVRQLIFLDEQMAATGRREPGSPIGRAMDLHFDEMKKAMVEIRHSAFVMPLVCSDATRNALDELLVEWLRSEQAGGTEYLQGVRAALSRTIDAVTDAAREDLRLVASEAQK